MINFIVNTYSGKGKALKDLKTLMDYCYRHKISYAVFPTERSGHAKEIAARLSENPCTIGVIGGDGTFHEVINGANLDNAKIGFIPSGSGNDFARAALLPKNPIEALQLIVEGKTAAIDYIDIDGLRCLNVAGTGLDVAVLERVYGRGESKMTYLMSLIYCLNHFSPYDVTVTKEDGEVLTRSCIMVGVCNGIAIGGGLKISPNSSIEDGKLNVVIMTYPKDGKIMKCLNAFRKGKHLDDPSITEHFLCESVSITSEANYPIQLDGEIYHDTPLNCRIVKGGITTFVR